MWFRNSPPNRADAYMVAAVVLMAFGGCSLASGFLPGIVLGLALLAPWGGDSAPGPLRERSRPEQAVPDAMI